MTKQIIYIYIKNKDWLGTEGSQSHRLTTIAVQAIRVAVFSSSFSLAISRFHLSVLLSGTANPYVYRFRALIFRFSIIVTKVHGTVSLPFPAHQIDFILIVDSHRSVFMVVFGIVLESVISF